MFFRSHNSSFERFLGWILYDGIFCVEIVIIVLSTTSHTHTHTTTTTTTKQQHSQIQLKSMLGISVVGTYPLHVVSALWQFLIAHCLHASLSGENEHFVMQ